MKLIILALILNVDGTGDWKFDEIHIREGRRNRNKELLDAAVASSIIQVVSDHQFNLKEDGAEPVNFEMRKGRLVVKNELDREKKSSYQMSIDVTNNRGDIVEKETTFTIVVDDANDNKPTFQKNTYTLRLDEHSPKGTLALSDDPSKPFIFATDADERSVRTPRMMPCEIGTGNGDITYQITGQKRDWFSVRTCYNDTIDQFVAQISLDSSDEQALDRENLPQLDFRLEARDMGFGKGNEPFFTSDPVRVKIELNDINDNPPEFYEDNILLSAKEDIPIIRTLIPVNSEIARIPVNDLDSTLANRAFTVNIQNDRGAVFKVKPSQDYTEVIVLNAKPLDYEYQSKHTFSLSIKSRDPLERVDPKAKVKNVVDVTVNVENVDEPPEFKKNIRVFIAENKESGYTIPGTKNMATDPENTSFSYELSERSIGVPFTVNQKTGELTNTRRLDHESQAVYFIELIAKTDDGQSQGRGNITIEVGDENDNKPRPNGTLTLTYCANEPSWTGSVNFTDLDTKFTTDLRVDADRTDKSKWEGVELVQTFTKNKATNEKPVLAVSVRTDNPDRYIRSGMELPIIIRDGKHTERFVLTVQRCSCAAPNDGNKCDSLRAAAVPLNAQIFWAVLIAVCFSLLTIIGFTFWRQSNGKKTTKSGYDSSFIGLEVDPEDKRDGVVEYNIESGEQDCSELISDMPVNGCPKLADIKEEQIDLPKLKEKLNSISQAYFIAPYDSLQLYQYEGTNSVVSSLSSLNTCPSETSLNLTGLAGSNKMAKVMKLFDSGDATIGPSGGLGRTLSRNCHATLGRPRNSCVKMSTNDGNDIADI